MPGTSFGLLAVCDAAFPDSACGCGCVLDEPWWESAPPPYDTLPHPTFALVMFRTKQCRRNMNRRRTGAIISIVLVSRMSQPAVPRLAEQRDSVMGSAHPLLARVVINGYRKPP